MAKGVQKNVNIKTDGLTRDEILSAIRMHNTACQKATAMIFVQYGEDGLSDLRKGLAQVEEATRGLPEVE